MTGPDTRNAESLASAVYFIVGRGTEGGPASYRLSVAGLNDGNLEASLRIAATR